MQNIELKPQYPGLASRLNSFGSVSHRSIGKQQNHKQPQQTKTKTTANLTERTHSYFGTLILVIATIALYSLGIYQLSNIVTNILQTVVEEVNPDYGFRVF